MVSAEHLSKYNMYKYIYYFKYDILYSFFNE